MAFQDLPKPARLYVTLIVVSGFAALVLAIGTPLSRPPDLVLAIFFALAVATSKLNVKVPYSSVHFSVDTAFVFVILMTYGLLPAILADMAGKLVLSLGTIRKSGSFKIPFNIASGALSVHAAHLCFTGLIVGGLVGPSAYVLPVIGMVVAYYVVNTGTVATAICITEHQNLLHFWIENFLPTGVAYATSGSVATLLFILEETGGVLGFVVTIPIVILIYSAQKTYAQKEEAAVAHIKELGELHLSTVQSLSLAIDAKDEHTHGHVHRVQCYAEGLARILGVTDEQQIQGIRFASLVHDIGKIAIPDAILNKPGKYSPEEFERMKSHSVIGAAILKDIPLPVPVSDIVRHHHEKWNGKGYPDGISGEDIPLESRIISVVDIYDALRSDRPYRPKMGKERAIEIMREESGTTLDPHMAAVFLENLDELEAAAEVEAQNVEDVVRNTCTLPEFEPFYARTETDSAQERRSLRLAHLVEGWGRHLAGESDLRALFAHLATTVGDVIPYTGMVVYVPTENRCTLVPAFAEARDPDDFCENVVAVSHGASGTAFAEQKPADGAPDAGEFRRPDRMLREYRSVLAVPLSEMAECFGVLTLYSSVPGNFSQEDRELLAQFAPFVASFLRAFDLSSDEGADDYEASPSSPTQ